MSRAGALDGARRWDPKNFQKKGGAGRGPKKVPRDIGGPGRGPKRKGGGFAVGRG